jgi:putative aldouronate transport system permease protein
MVNHIVNLLKLKNKKKIELLDFVVVSIMLLVNFICLFPLLYVVSVSITPITEVIKHGFMVIPTKISFDAYVKIIEDRLLPNAMGVTIFITVTGTALNLILSMLTAYPLSRKNLPFRRSLIQLVIFTMLFTGGIIPTFLVVKYVGLYDTIWALIIPSAMNTYNVIVLKSFIERLPNDIFESAYIDGAKEMRILMQFVVPLSKPALMTIGMFYALQHWNTYLSGIMYISAERLYPLQIVLRRLLSVQMDLSADITVSMVTKRMASVVFATIPIVMVYPFIQKYFTKGMTLGAVKG